MFAPRLKVFSASSHVSVILGFLATEGQWWEQRSIIQGWQRCSRNLTSLMKTGRETKTGGGKKNRTEAASDGRSNEWGERGGAAAQRLTGGFQVSHKCGQDRGLALIYVVIKLLEALCCGDWSKWPQADKTLLWKAAQTVCNPEPTTLAKLL